MSDTEVCLPQSILFLVILLAGLAGWMTLAFLAARHEFKHNHPVRGAIAVVLGFAPLLRLGWL